MVGITRSRVFFLNDANFRRKTRPFTWGPMRPGFSPTFNQLNLVHTISQTISPLYIYIYINVIALLIQTMDLVKLTVAMTPVVSFRGRNKRFPLIRLVLELETKV